MNGLPRARCQPHLSACHSVTSIQEIHLNILVTINKLSTSLNDILYHILHT